MHLKLGQPFTIKKESLLIFAVFLLFFSFFEKLFMPDGLPTGSYNAQFGMLALLILVLVYLLKNFKTGIHKDVLLFLISIYSLLFIHLLFLHGDTREFLRYILVLGIFVLSAKVPLPNLRSLSKFFIIIALYFYLLDIEKTERFTGFINTSPTVFSLIMVSTASILFLTSKRKIDWLFALVAVFFIIESGSRSTLAVLVILIGYRVFMKVKPIMRFIIILCILPIGYFLTNNFSTLETQYRQNGEQSTSTRLYLIENTFYDMNDNPSIYFIGEGAGSLYEKYDSFPVHFDPLVILYDYGIIGLLFMLLLPIRLLGLNLYTVSFLLLGSFHNLIYFPVGIAFFVLTIRYLTLKSTEGEIRVKRTENKRRHYKQISNPNL